MTPEGPFRSAFTTGNWWLIRVVVRRAECFAIVRDGTQPADAQLVFPSRREAVSWAKDNGYEKK